MMRTMNRINIVCVLMAFMMLVGCGDHYESRTGASYIPMLGYYDINISPNTYMFDKAGGTVNVEVRPINTGWISESAADWLSVSPANGGESDGYTNVSINAKENNMAGANRIGLVSFTSTNPDWNYSSYFTATQYPGAALSPFLLRPTMTGRYI